MSARQRKQEQAAAQARRRKRLFIKRALFFICAGALLGGMLLGHALLTGCAVIVHTEDHVRVEVDRSNIHVAPKVEVRNDRRHEQAI